VTPSNNSVTREGNSYSGTNVSGDISINGRPAGGGLLAAAGIPGYGSAATPSPVSGGQNLMARAFPNGISAQNNQAAENLASNSQNMTVGQMVRSGQLPPPNPEFSGTIGQTSGVGNMWSRSPEQQRRDAEVQASSIHRRTAALGNDALRALDAQDFENVRGANAFQREILRARGQLQQTEMQEQGAIRRALLGDAGNTQRTAMEQGGALQRTAMQEAGHLERQQIAGRATVDAANARSQAPAGYRYTTDGSLAYIPGGPADPAVRGSRAPLNDTQAKALQFGTRMQEAGKNLDQLAAQGVDQPGLIKRLAGDGAIGNALNWTQSPEQQQVEQSQRDYINAVLRRESGAAIADSEFNNARKQYFPQVGDSPEVTEQKRQNREIATAGIMAEVPDAEKRVGQVLGAAQRSTGAQQPQVPGAQGAQSTGARTATRSGTMNGRRVIQYSDGSVEYAD
jgi:hypothetical protein